MRSGYFDYAVLALAAGLSSMVAMAEPARDPTQPPAAYGAPAASNRPAAEAFRLEHLVSVNGVRYLVWNSRRYQVGDSISGARIERISESAIWLRSEGSVRKLLLFPGIEKRPLDSGTAIPPNSSGRSRADEKNGPSK